MLNNILHCDLNSFFAAVECAMNPSIRNLPVAVGGDPESRRGIILAKNTLSKKYNIKTGEPLWQARQKCPQLHIIKPHNARYIEFSQAARNIYLDYSDKVESFGIDECWLDVSCNKFMRTGSGEQIAGEIRRRIFRELGITCSIGVSWNKAFAKLGSDYKKPDAVTIIDKNNYKTIVWPLPAERLLYIGPATAGKLKRLGIYTIGDLAMLDKNFIRSCLGKNGAMLHDYANGRDFSEVRPNDFSRIIKSVGNSTTTPCDLSDNNAARRTLLLLADSVAGRLRKYHLKALQIQLHIRDKDLCCLERQAPLPEASCLTQELATAAFQLFRSSYNWHKPVRSLGLRAARLTDEACSCQYDLFGKEARREKIEKLEHCIDNIRARYGSGSVTRALLLKDAGNIITGKGAPAFTSSIPVAQADWELLQKESE